MFRRRRASRSDPNVWSGAPWRTCWHILLISDEAAGGCLNPSMWCSREHSPSLFDSHCVPELSAWISSAQVTPMWHATQQESLAMSDTSLTSSVKHSLISLIVLANIQTFHFTLCVYFSLHASFARSTCSAAVTQGGLYVALLVSQPITF